MSSNTEIQKLRDIQKNLEEATGISLDTSKLKSKMGDQKAFAEELKKLLAEASLEKVKDYENTMTTNLTSLVKGLTDVMDSLGVDIAGYQTYDSEEQGVIDSAKKAHEEAKELLALLQAKPNTWFNRFFFSLERKIEEAKNLVKITEQNIPLAEKKALDMRSARIDKADFTESTETIIQYCDVIIDILDQCMESSKEKREDLDAKRIELQQTLEEAEKGLKTTRAKLKQKESALEIAQQELANCSVDEKAVIEGKIAQLQIELEKVRSVERDTLEIHNASERFRDISLGQIKSFEVTNATIQAIRTGLRSKTDSRVKSYAAVVEQLKNSNALRVASNLDQAGNATDEKIMQLTAQLMKSAVTDFKERLFNHPTEMVRNMTILEEMLKIADSFKTDIKEYQQMIEKGFAETQSKKKVVKHEDE